MSSVLNWISWTPPSRKKFLGTPLPGTYISKAGYFAGSLQTFWSRAKPVASVGKKILIKHYFNGFYLINCVYVFLNARRWLFADVAIINNRKMIWIQVWFRYSPFEVLGSVEWQLLTDVSGQPIGFTFTSQAVDPCSRSIVTILADRIRAGYFSSWCTSQQASKQTNWLSPCSSVLLHALCVHQLVKKFFAFYEARRFITVLTTSPNSPYPEPQEYIPHFPVLLFQYPLQSVQLGRDSSVGIATRYGLDSQGIESRWVRVFPHPSRTALGPTQPRVQ